MLSVCEGGTCTYLQQIPYQVAVPLHGALLCFPSATAALLVGAPLEAPIALTVARVGGAGLLALGVACWLARGDTQSRAARGLVAAVGEFFLFAEGYTMKDQSESSGVFRQIGKAFRDLMVRRDDLEYFRHRHFRPTPKPPKQNPNAK
jgi:hypothetical protein